MLRQAPPPPPRPVPPAESPRPYRVVGPHIVYGVKPGGIVKLTSIQADSLVRAGHIVSATTPRDSSSRENKEG